MPTKTKTKKPGNCGCTICGLRGSSKNVWSRNIFPIWPEEVENTTMGLAENCITIKEVDGHNMFGLRESLYNLIKYKGKSDAFVFAEFIRTVKQYDPELAHLDKLFCAHEWRQDPGTETV